MTDMSSTIIPKSDQLNSDDLIGGQTRTIKINRVSIVMGEQPVAIHYDGDNGKPYKPGKSMRRVLVNAWGPDANSYVGRSLTLYRDDKVTFGGAAVGGIRISSMSHIPGPITMALTASKTVRKPFTVQPLVAAVEPLDTTDYEQFTLDTIYEVSIAPDSAAIDAILKSNNEKLRKLEKGWADNYYSLKQAVQDKRKSFGATNTATGTERE